MTMCCTYKFIYNAYIIHVHIYKYIIKQFFLSRELEKCWFSILLLNYSSVLLSTFLNWYHFPHPNFSSPPTEWALSHTSLFIRLPTIRKAIPATLHLSTPSSVLTFHLHEALCWRPAPSPHTLMYMNRGERRSILKILGHSLEIMTQ